MKNRGFTLVELSIVLVIIGLLVGGILIAQSMISTARQQKVLKDISEIKTMTQNFLTTYKCQPGDCDGTFLAANLRGNGDGIIGYFSETITHKRIISEMGFFPITEDLSGCRSNISWDDAPKACFFKGSLKESIMMINSTYTANCGGANCDLGYGPNVNKVSAQHGDNYILYGHDRDIGSGIQDYAKPQGFFKPIDAAAIDKKVDDGMPNTGRVFGYFKYPNNTASPTGYNARCISPYNVADLAANYFITEATLSCGIAFLMGNLNDIDTSF